MKNFIEQHIWDYIDGTLDKRDRDRIKTLIETEPVYKETYKELLQINAGLEEISLDEPSMRFTVNLMDKLKNEPVPGSVNALVNKSIIRTIGFFFIITILGILAIALFQTNWTQSSEYQHSNMNFPEWKFSVSLNKQILLGFLFIDVIIGLYVFDGILRMKLIKKK